ncbi:MULTISPECIES: manganese-dependent inorganic pyrophosphatase [Leptotrichia]|jgi:probable manganese-dependent inorganic pyrophosphatase|uniref:Probable manganese-dependent inorganic pyrophosphatase n=1 Tax=Leptotrichia wadei TaxID=157687 RepID=A0A510KVJ2_9FUSO|nr:MULTISPECIES: manganese-dependent inorganic pyrophosphatase [Leptotrichia]MBS6019799.1 manganese-dependent inorganic pyrophosphatase [Leptotrichia wadei]NWO28100.1 manganese-dependent inorganic pyrophosphatase [Leptotrichia sp. oral taxon 417]BBM55722.1 inorganic diphosphatase [Leptotrichia wadei]
MSILVFGHKNPDTDTICSAIAYAELKNKLGKDVKAVRLGEVNEETKYALNYFKVEKPELVENVAGKEIILVDHNERTQTADGFEEAKVLELIDHHRISNFNVDEPLYARVEPVGCTATIILKLFKENGLAPSKETAGLMLSAIISDTLLFKSPTCTQCDAKAGKELAEIAGVDLKEYGLEMLKAGTALGDKSEAELLNMDMKIFEIDGEKIGVAQVNTVNEAEVLERKEKLLAEIDNIIAKEGLKFFMLAITNILTNDSTALVSGNGNDVIEKAFGEKVDSNLVTLKGVVSRKKQIIPPLTKAIQG